MPYQIKDHRDPTQVDMGVKDPSFCKGSGEPVGEFEVLWIGGQLRARCPHCIRLQPAKEIKR